LADSEARVVFHPKAYHSRCMGNCCGRLSFGNDIVAPGNSTKKTNQSINSMTPPIVQHFYLRTSTAGLLTKDGAPVPPEHRGHPVGVIAMTFMPNGTIRFSGSLVSKKDVFLKKTGVAKAHGRLANDATAAELPVEQFKTFTTASLAATLGLYTKHGNRFNEIDWQRAELTKLSALDSLEARCGKQPA